MTTDEVLDQLRARGSDKLRAQSMARGVGGEQFGVMMGDIRKLAKAIKKDHALAMDLWATEVLEARLLAILIMDIKALTPEALDNLVRSNTQTPVSDWLNSYIVKAHPDKETLRQKWMASQTPIAARAGWSLTAERIEKSPEGLDLPALLARIEAELASADELPKWTMNVALAYIGIHHPKLRERALAIGNKLGVYRDYPTAKGCTSPFAPFWIAEMVSRQTSAP